MDEIPKEVRKAIESKLEEELKVEELSEIEFDSAVFTGIQHYYNQMKDTQEQYLNIIEQLKKLYSSKERYKGYNQIMKYFQQGDKLWFKAREKRIGFFDEGENDGE